MTNALPEDIAPAVVAYEAAHEQIRSRVDANRRRYRGTKYEDCPPLLPEQLALMVRRSEVLDEHRRLEERYGPCLRRWAFAVVWFRHHTCDQAAHGVSMGKPRKRKVPNPVVARAAKKPRA